MQPDEPQASPDVAAAARRSFGARWKHEALFSEGYIPIPVALLRHYQHLRPGVCLTPAEFLFVLHLMEYKWDKNRPFPSYARIAKQMGVSDKMVRRYAKQLEEKGFLSREARVGNTNLFDLDPLFDALLAAHNRANALPDIEVAL